MKTLAGKLVITRTHSNDGDGHISIMVEDELSHCRMIEIRIAPGPFAETLVGHCQQSCEVDFNDSGIIGMKREHKTEVVFIPNHDWKNRETVARKAIAAHEKDGWEGRDDDAMNHHCRAGSTEGGANYRVTFVRFVPVDVNAK